MRRKGTIAVILAFLIIPFCIHPTHASSSFYSKTDTGGENVIFYDDFNDNSKDYSKWKEIYTDGIWEEKNGRAEFTLHEGGDKTAYEGIESISFSVFLNPLTPLNISWDIITDIGSTGWAGRIYMEVTDGTHWIWAMYHRYREATMFMDSNDEEAKYINEYEAEGELHNLMQIYSDRYIVYMGGRSSGVIEESIFPPDAELKVRIYIADSGSQPDLYMKSAFDNVFVTFEEPHLGISFIMGKIENLTSYGEDIVTFNANFVILLHLLPPSIDIYDSGEKLILLEPKRGAGIVTINYIFGVFHVGIVE